MSDEMVGEIVVLPGCFNASVEAPTAPRRVLMAAAELGLRDVVVVGRTIAGEVEVEIFSSQVDVDAAVGLLMRGVRRLTDAEQVSKPGPAARA